MAVNKVIYGNTTVLDITDSTVTPETLAKGEVGYSKAGERIVGTMEAGGGASVDTCTVEITSYEQNIKLVGATVFVDGVMQGRVPVGGVMDAFVTTITVENVVCNTALFLRIISSNIGGFSTKNAKNIDSDTSLSTDISYPVFNITAPAGGTATIKVVED